jgi:hypothetical protein
MYLSLFAHVGPQKVCPRAVELAMISAQTVNYLRSTLSSQSYQVLLLLR